VSAIVASAPGKLVLCGEYAVLEGARAIVLALDRRARVTLQPIMGDACVIDAPGLGIHGAFGRLDGQGHMAWSNVAPAVAVQLQLVAAVIEEALTEGPVAAFRAQLDTAALFAVDEPSSKLGLGSSAALAVALAGAIALHAGRPLPAAARLVAAHRRMQAGRGSGLDIAASLSGGSILYRLLEGEPQIAPVAWPQGLGFACVWSGKSASTGVFLRGLAAWRERAGVEYAALLRELAICAEAAAKALATAAVHDLLLALAAYGQVLARLGNASGLDIVCAEHRTLAALAADCGVVYKSCGAGGGDLGIALGTDADRLAAFRQAVTRQGMRNLDLRIDPLGLQVQRTNRGNP
jgi:phosphomevalonate kinase